MKLNSNTKISLIYRGKSPYEKDSAEDTCLYDLRSVSKGREFFPVSVLLKKYETSIGFYEESIPKLLEDGMVEIQDSLFDLIDTCEQVIDDLPVESKIKLKLALERAKE